jgi:hypothetical protein
MKRSRSLAAQTARLVISNKNKVRYADIYKEATRPFTNHPVCAGKERNFLLKRSHPYQETAPVTPLSSVGIKTGSFFLLLVWTQDSWDTP